MSDLVFVVEACQNCKEHGWNTRHDEAKYQEFFKKIAQCIIDRIPSAMIMKNQIPKQYLNYDIYNNLVQNDDETCPYYQMVPRTGAFEVSYKGLLIFSKLKGGYWPNCELVADKCFMVVQEEAQGNDCTQFLAGNTPIKGGGFIQSQKKGLPVTDKKNGNTQQVQATPLKKMPKKIGEQNNNTQDDDTTQEQQLKVQENNQPPIEHDKISVSSKFHQSNLNLPQVDSQIICGSHLQNSSELEGFPIFPKGTKSLLSKCLTKDIWNLLKDQKDKYGFPFRDAIFSGCKNTDSGIGVYAGSHDSYQIFAPLLDQIILKYHGHKKSDMHQAETPNITLNAPDFPPEEAKMIISTRIRVGRNLDGFPLGPGLYTSEQRAAVENKVTTALKNFDGELKGKYYSLDSLTDAERNQLIQDHFLFKEGDRFLEACGLNRDWPKNRGIFHNDKKTFLTWVNEEDQLRIISMQPGSNIRQVFERLTLALQKFENIAKFSYDDHLGFITSCPTNLGTAMRASVHIQLPLLSQQKKVFQEIADKYHVQIRGAHGEHTESDDGIFDISNIRRLGRSMTLLVQDMYDGVKAMIKKELELQQALRPVDSIVKAGPHLKKPEDIYGMVEFPKGTSSLLSKYLTKEVYEKYRGQQDKSGVSFEQMILSGSQNVDSGIGCYAGSHDSYYTFSDLFDKVIEDYHKHGKNDKHKSDMDYTKLNCPPFTKEEAAMIQSTRIRVGRNLADFPLGPGISREQRNKVEELVSGALSSMTGELQGQYYSLSSLSEADRQKLIDDHFLFKEGDRFLESCGLNRDWPEGRGIFHNKEKTFLVWINEEDQLRIISMQQDADILAVFTRLSKAAAEIEKVSKFSHDEYLGYITSCPTNLGTALRASVHIKLPYLAKNKAKFEEIADKYYVQIRGIHGEHTETDDGVFDISNKRRLGRSERDLVQDMYDGVKAMIKAELELAPKKQIEVPVLQNVKAGPHLKKPEDITGMVEFPAGTKSLLCKYLTPNVYLKYRGQKDAAGVSFEQMILSGSQNVDSGIGVYAGSHDSYTAFADLFDNVIEDYHKHTKMDKHVSDMDYTKLNCPPFTEQESSMILSTRIRVGRNLAGFPLGPGISRQQRNEVEQLVSGALQSMTEELQGSYYALNSLTDQDRQKLIEDHFLFKEGDRFLESCGLNRDWPEGRGIFHNQEKTFLVWINEEDQLRIISMQPGADILAVFTRLSKAASAVEKVSKFAHDDHLGYITSCPTNLGTALRASVHIKLPLLAKNKTKFNEIADKYYVQIRGIHGEHTETDDGVFDISNKRRLGRSEKDLVQDMYDGVKAMIHAEIELGKPVIIENIKAGSHLKKPEDITGFIEFPNGTKSLLSKYLTRDVYLKYRLQQDQAGVSFEQMILSGSQNVDSGIGCYAGSHDSYYTFSDLFDKVIEDYHKHGKNDKHKSDMDYTKLNCPPFTKEEAAMIQSTRIRVGRNLADFPLGPGISREQRNKVEQLVSGALQKMTGELQGTYYALSSLSEEDRKQLIEDHFLFKEGDRFLESCGLNRDWPEGRGIFHNKEKTFLVWINEEDQLRIISMQQGADILAVFTRLSKAASEIEKVAKFAHDDRLGYITSCPTNLGTALRASVHIKLPYLSKNKVKFNEIADKYYVQIRGIHGEHTESDDGVFDISNKRRLGRSERDLVQDMYDGVKAMIKAEIELTPKPVDVKAGPHLKKPEDITGMVIFPEGTKSLLSKYLTPEVYTKYRNKKDKSGVSFEQMILSGSQNVDSGIGLYAGSYDSYYTFSDLFDKVIEDYHKHGKQDKHKSDMDYTKLNCPPFTKEEAEMIQSTRIRVGRNLADFPLGPGISREQRNKVEELVSGALSSMTGELQGQYYSLSSLSEADRQKLIDDHFLFKEGDRFLESCGLNRDWPEGRGIFHNKEKTFLVWINEEDQLRIISMQQDADILAVFTRLSKAAAEIEKVSKFSHDEYLGYITSCPTNLGTALRASVHIKLPNLAKSKVQFEEIADKYYVQIRGIHGEHTETDDGVFDISNKRRLGRSERELVQDMYDGVKAMIKAEIELRPKEIIIQAGPHLLKPEDITGFVQFPEGTHSLLSKYLTKDIYSKYKGQKDKAGVSFEQMILSGSQNIDSGIGCYAGSHDSYYTFQDLFDKVIEDYHKHGKQDKHVSDMDYTKLNCPPFTKEEAVMIQSTRIRVGRNLADFPLGPGISREQRNKVEELVSGALSSMTGELQGQYYALNSLSESDRKQLIEDHFLFKEGDRFLESCGLNRDWPEGRGIFHNKEKTFLVWINEEDQLRIISMQQDADILAVFTRLSKAAAEVEKVAKFSHDEHLGYITSCPTNLGTALRASVHIKLPYLSQHKEKFQEIADKYYVQIRGIHGEHTETDDGVYDISNKRRLGRSERDLVQDMYDGVKAMIKAEIELAPKKQIVGTSQIEIPVQNQDPASIVEQVIQKVKAGEHLKKPEDITGMVEFPEGTQSLLSKYLTLDVYSKYRGQKDKAGVSFEQMILSGSQNIDSGIGCYAGSHNSYYTFSDLFDKVIEDYHKHGKEDKHVSDMDYTKLNCPPLNEVESKMIISTRIRVGRNLADFPLGPGITRDQRNQIEKLVSGVLSSMTGELQGQYYSLTSLSEADRKQLIDDHFLFKEGDRFLESCGLNRDWPEGRGIFHNKEKSFLVWINEEDQLRIISMQLGSDIKQVFARLSIAAAEIEKVAKFAHDEHLGYITSCPTNLGTALRASVHIKLPQLSKNKAKFNEIADKYYVQIRGIHGEHTETDDGIFDISNKRRLGRSERDLVQDMYDGVKAMINAELELSKQ